MLNWMRVDSDVRRVGRFVLFQEGSFQSEFLNAQDNSKFYL